MSQQSCTANWHTGVALRIFLIRFRALGTNIWPISSNCLLFSLNNWMFSRWLPGNPGPFPNETSRNSHLLRGPKALIRQIWNNFNLTQRLGVAPFTRDVCPEFGGLLSKNHQRKNGRRFLTPFLSQNQLIPRLSIISHSTAGALCVLQSGTRTKGWPPDVERKRTNPFTR